MRRIAMSLTLVCALALSAAAQQDFSKVEVRIDKVAGSVYLLTGSGGNIAASVGPDGIVLVDTEYAPLADKIRAALRTVSDKPVRWVIDTHWHGDHTSGNVAFGPTATIIAHTNVRTWLSTEQKSVFGQAVPALPPAGWPTLTYDRELIVHGSGEDARLYHFPNSHTDGDTVIIFPASNVVHMGDNLVIGRFPIIDVPHGGSARGILDVNQRVLAMVPNDARIIPGHGPLATTADMRAFIAMLRDSTNIVQEGIRQGKTADQMKEAAVLKKYESLGDKAAQDRFLDFLYADLSRKQ